MTKDTKRLNWLEKHKAGLNTGDLPPRPHVWVINSTGEILHFFGNTYRRAIDNAMEVVK